MSKRKSKEEKKKNNLFELVELYTEQAYRANEAISKLEKKYLNNKEISKDINEFLDTIMPMIDTYNELIGRFFTQALIEAEKEERERKEEEKNQ